MWLLLHLFWVKLCVSACFICSGGERRTSAVAWFVHTLTWWPRVRRGCRRDPVHHARPGQLQQSYLGLNVCLVNLNNPEPVISFAAYRMVYSTLLFFFFFLHTPAKWRIIGKWESAPPHHPCPFLFPAFSRPSVQHILPFHSSWACLRLVTQKKSHQASGGQSLSGCQWDKEHPLNHTLWQAGTENVFHVRVGGGGSKAAGGSSWPVRTAEGPAKNSASVTVEWDQGAELQQCCSLSCGSEKIRSVLST